MVEMTQVIRDPHLESEGTWGDTYRLMDFSCFIFCCRKQDRKSQDVDEDEKTSRGGGGDRGRQSKLGGEETISRADEI